jgi:hypothetical protein
MFIACQDNLMRIIKLLVDSGYSGDDFAAAVLQAIRASVEVAKRSELHAFAVIPNAGWSNVPSPGSTNAAGFGKTMNASSTPACKWLC